MSEETYKISVEEILKQYLVGKTVRMNDGEFREVIEFFIEELNEFEYMGINICIMSTKEVVSCFDDINLCVMDWQACLDMIEIKK